VRANQKTRRIEMLLENKIAIVYGGGGAIGGAVARAFAREGANVFLAGEPMRASRRLHSRSALQEE
jgi:NAD(P)-dependent dehydrogenase (short-subunit alcohol dehydrogenase family)